MTEVNLQDLKLQAIIQELHNVRNLAENAISDRCAGLAGALAVKTKQAEDAQAKVVELTDELSKLKDKKKPKQDEAPK